MKKFATLFSALSLISSAVTAAPVVLPKGPIYVDFFTDEQYSKTNDIANALNPARAGGPGGNWGIVEVESIRVGQALAPTGSQIDPLGPTIFSNTVGGQQILGIFFGVQNNPEFPATSTGGALDLYFFESNNQVIGNEFVNANLSKRSGVDGSQYTGLVVS